MPDGALTAALGGGVLAAAALLGVPQRSATRWLSLFVLLIGAVATGAAPASWDDAAELASVPAGLLALHLWWGLSPRSQHPAAALWVGGDAAARGLSLSQDLHIRALARCRALALLSPLGSVAGLLGWLLDPAAWLLLTAPPAVLAWWRSRGTPAAPSQPRHVLPTGLLSAGVAMVALSSGASWMAGRGWLYASRQVGEPAVALALAGVAQLPLGATAAAFVGQVPWPPGVDTQAAAVALFAVGLRPLASVWTLWRGHGRQALKRAVPWLGAPLVWLLVVAAAR